MSGFKVGDYIKCLDIISERDLTINKTYKVVDFYKNSVMGWNMVTISNDVNKECRYYEYRFELDRVAIRCETIDGILE